MGLVRGLTTVCLGPGDAGAGVKQLLAYFFGNTVLTKGITDAGLYKPPSSVSCPTALALPLLCMSCKAQTGNAISTCIRSWSLVMLACSANKLYLSCLYTLKSLCDYQ